MTRTEGAASPTTIERHEIAGRRFAIERQRDDEPLVRASIARGDLDPSYWTRLWPTARSMTEWTMRSSMIGSGTAVLEIGCGLGLVGIAAARRGAEVLMTDLDERGVALARRNVALNGARAEAERFDWREPPPAAWTPDVVLGSDVLYREAAHAEIARLMTRLGERGACLGVLGDPNRPAADGAREAFEDAGLRVWVTPMRSGRVFMVQG